MLKYGVRKFIFLNGHGGNGPALDDTALWIYRQGGIAAIIDWWSLAAELNSRWSGGHGTGQETSMMMALRPGWINREGFLRQKLPILTDRMPSKYINAVSFGKGTIRIPRNVDEISSSGAFGEDDPREAAPELGEEIITGIVSYLRDFIEAFPGVCPYLMLSTSEAELLEKIDSNQLKNHLLNISSFVRQAGSEGERKSRGIHIRTAG